jgi:hypothetical protein
MARHLPETFEELVRAGGPEGMARAAAERAANEERQFWLDILEGMKPPDDAWVDMYRSTYIRDLRRRLSIKPSVEIVRAQTRERVRRLRERRRSEQA